MKKLIKLTPLEPYFFGGERIFEIDDNNKHYFIRSLDTPSQTALFGVLRFLGCNPINGKILGPDDTENVGDKSFDLAKGITESTQSFGRIERISPLYLIDNKGNYYIRTPFDHNVKSPKYTCDTSSDIPCDTPRDTSCDTPHDTPSNTLRDTPRDTQRDTLRDTPCYTPFEMSSEKILTSKGIRIFPKAEEYDPKVGIADSWMNLTDMTVHTNLFSGVVRVGIDKKNTKKAFVKKEFKRLEAGFSFAFFADVTNEFMLYERAVFMGQGKSTFSVEIHGENDFKEPDLAEFKKYLRNDTVYAQSDIYFSDDMVQNVEVDQSEDASNPDKATPPGKTMPLYDDCRFVCVKTRDFRVFTTNDKIVNAKGRYKKGENIQLIQAGSIFISNNTIKFWEKLEINKHASKAGFNQVLIGGME